MINSRSPTELLPRVEKWPNYTPREWKSIEQLRSPNDDKDGENLRTTLHSMIAKYPTMFKGAGVLKWLWRYQSASGSGDFRSVMYQDQLSGDYVGELSSEVLEQNPLTAGSTKNLVRLAASPNEPNLLVSLLFKTKAMEPGDKLRDTWWNKLRIGDAFLPKAEGIYELGIDIGNNSYEESTSICLKVATEQFLQNQIMTDQENMEEARELLQKISPNSEVFKTVGIHNTNVWSENGSLLGRSGRIENMYVRLVRKENLGEFFKDVSIGELANGNWQENVKRVVGDGDNWRPETKLQLEDADRAFGPPLFVATIDTAYRDIEAPRDDFDYNVNTGKTICNFYIRRDGTASLLPSHMAVDGKIMAELQKRIEGELGVKEVNLEKFFPLKLEGEEGWCYNVKIRRENGVTHDEIVENLGVREVNVAILRPAAVEEMENKMLERMTTELGLPTQANEEYFSKKEGKLASQIMYPRVGKYPLVSAAINAYRQEMIANMAKKHIKVEERGGGKSAAICVPVFKPGDRLGVAPTLTTVEVDPIALAATQAVLTNNYEPKQYESPQEVQVMMQQALKEQLDLRNLTRLAGFNIGPLLLERRIAENRNILEKISNALNKDASEVLSLGVQISQLPGQPLFSTAPSGEKRMELVLGLSERLGSYTFQVATGIGKAKMIEKLKETTDRARNGWNDPGIMLLRKILAHTGTNMNVKINLKEISKRIKKLRESPVVEDILLAKEAIQWLVIDTCKDMAVDMEKIIEETAKGYDHLFDTAHKKRVTITR